MPLRPILKLSSIRDRQTLVINRAAIFWGADYIAYLLILNDITVFISSDFCSYAVFVFGKVIKSNDLFISLEPTKNMNCLKKRPIVNGIFHL